MRNRVCVCGGRGGGDVDGGDQGDAEGERVNSKYIYRNQTNHNNNLSYTMANFFFTCIHIDISSI